MADRLARMTDDELGRTLAGLAAELAFPEPTTDLAALAVARIREGALARRPAPGQPLRRAARWVGGLLPPRGIRRALVLALLIVVAASAVAGAAYFGVRGIQIVFRPGPGPSASASGSSPAPGSPTPTPSPSLPSLGDRLALGRRTTLAGARAAVSFPVAVPAPSPTLREPLVFVSDEPFGGRVSFVWTAPGKPMVARLFLTEFQARPNRVFIEKLVFGGTSVKRLRIGGALAYWLSGAAHEIDYIDPDGIPYNDRTRLAGNTLVWTKGSVTLRLEGAPTLRQALAVARSTH
jgi:hypothetical protein